MIASTRELVLESLNDRFAVRKFDRQREISPEDWETLASALRLSPSGYGLQPWKFLVVRDRKVRAKLTPFSLHQPQVEDCSHLIVFTARATIDEAYLEEF